ncbi:MAG: VanZ family protein [Anaeromyxobacter sp.]
MAASPRLAFGRALAAYMALVVAAVALVPYEFRWPARFELCWTLGLADLVTNVALFVPLGYLVGLSRGEPSGRVVLRALAAGALLSVAIEVTQWFVPGRYTQLSDVATNAAGAALGALLHGALRRAGVSDPVERVFRLDLPLMTNLYLLLPILWLDGLAATGDPARLWLLAGPGLVGAGLAAEASALRRAEAGAPGQARLLAFVLGWFAVGTLPVAWRRPGLVGGLAVALAAVALAWHALARRGAGRERRRELPALRRAAPAFLAYLATIALWRPPLAGTPFGALSFEARVAATFRFVEVLAAFTLLGYAIAEVRGRREEPASRLGLLVAATAAAGYGALLALGGAFSTGAHAAEAAGVVAGALAGAAIYRLQRAMFAGPGAQGLAPSASSSARSPSSSNRKSEKGTLPFLQT